MGFLKKLSPFSYPHFPIGGTLGSGYIPAYPLNTAVGWFWREPFCISERRLVLLNKGVQPGPPGSKRVLAFKLTDLVRSYEPMAINSNRILKFTAYSRKNQVLVSRKLIFHPPPFLKGSSPWFLQTVHNLDSVIPNSVIYCFELSFSGWNCCNNPRKWRNDLTEWKTGHLHLSLESWLLRSFPLVWKFIGLHLR